LSACIGFLKACARELKGPVDLFKGFQQEPEEPFRLRIWNDPETGRSQNPAEVGGGGCIKVVSELDFVCILQAEGARRKGRQSVEAL
jgi:hypothetical protein